jgi:hypothetical protein
MDKFNTLCSLVSQANLLIGQLDLETLINNQNNQIENLTKENTGLKELVDGLNKQIRELNFKYDKDMELLSNELKSKQEELSSLTKVSYIHQVNKQLVEKTNYCQILESQLDKLRREQNQPIQPNPVIEKLAKKAADAEAEAKAQKEECEKAKLNVGKKAKKQAPNAVEQDVPDIITNQDPDIIVEKSVSELIAVENVVIESEQLKKGKKSKKLVVEQVDVIEEISKTEPLDVTEEPVEQKKGKKTKKQLVVDEEPEEIVLPEITVPEITVPEITVPEITVPDTVVEIEQPKKNKKSKKIIEEQLPEPDTKFNPDNFEDLNGFELLMYKSNYYLRDLETSELYDINANKPDKIVGLITGKGKVKLH